MSINYIIFLVALLAGWSDDTIYFQVADQTQIASTPVSIYCQAFGCSESELFSIDDMCGESNAFSIMSECADSQVFSIDGNCGQSDAFSIK